MTDEIAMKDGIEVIADNAWLQERENGQFETPAPIPNLTARQFRLGLLSLGKLNDVPTAIAALPSPEREQAEIEWQFASEFRRDHPLIVQIIPILGLTDEQVDPVWEQFSTV